MMSFDRGDYPGGTEYRILITPLARELIRAGVFLIGAGLLLLILYLL